MNETQALQLLDNIASRVNMNRESHGAAMDAVGVLQRALLELASLREKLALAESAAKGVE